MDLFAWGGNVLSSICIIFLTKLVMANYGFMFATTICGLHFLSCAIAIRTSSALGYTEHVAIPFRDVLVFSLIGAVSIASANLSLMMNTVGFYQIAKLLLAPFVCAVESMFMGKRFSVPVLVCILVTLLGVGIVTVSDVQSNLMGTVMAMIFVVSSGLQQILCGHFQSKHQLASHQLLANTAPVQGLILTCIGPSLDWSLTGMWIGDWVPTRTGVNVLMTSCVVAIAVNLSQFLCLGRFSATSFQVLGHAKTVLVLFGGWAFFNDLINLRQLAGMTLAVLGMIAYGFFMSRGGVSSKGDAKK
ncbi:hypothetical protein FOA52_008351 [Chlamydomonas sp. UWO 241]|nr:hypothetical protein FOA52_008351 [Chlamydomonas sp. UWO 241]